MAKGNSRKRASGKVKVDVKEVPKVQRLMPLDTNEAQYFEELKGASNRYAEALTNQTKYKHIITQLQKSRGKIQKGDIKMPINLTLIPNIMSYPEEDKVEILKIFDETIKNYVKSLQAIDSKVDYFYEAFVESGIRNREYLARRFKDVIAKQITPQRTAIKDETTIFEAEIDELLGDPKKQEKAKADAKKAMKVAVEHNKNLAKQKVKR